MTDFLISINVCRAVSRGSAGLIALGVFLGSNCRERLFSANEGRFFSL